ncbi:MAG: hypothetical protein PHF86_06260 [Candidatus Nanoarchaeia archaeon]|nr:hypothetical protein [Candidatus Nanoarchaeia archaeon]
MDYKSIFENVAAHNETLKKGEQAATKLKEIFEQLTVSCPETCAFVFYKWNKEYTINFLLHFIESKGLTQELCQLADMFNEDLYV